MMSAGLVGSPGLGYAKDRFSGEALQSNAAAYAEYKAGTPQQVAYSTKPTASTDRSSPRLLPSRRNSGRPTRRRPSTPYVTGNRQTLRVDSFIPAAMALIYLLLIIYFKGIGGYKPVHIEGTEAAKAAH